MTNLEQALKTADEALQAYENHRSPFADDWAMLALELKRALEELKDAAKPEYEYGIRYKEHAGQDSLIRPTTEQHVESLHTWADHIFDYFRRLKAGEWEEVK